MLHFTNTSERSTDIWETLGDGLLLLPRIVWNRRIVIPSLQQDPYSNGMRALAALVCVVAYKAVISLAILGYSILCCSTSYTKKVHTYKNLLLSRTNSSRTPTVLPIATLLAPEDPVQPALPPIGSIRLVPDESLPGAPPPADPTQPALPPIGSIRLVPETSLPWRAECLISGPSPAQPDPSLLSPNPELYPSCEDITPKSTDPKQHPEGLPNHLAACLKSNPIQTFSANILGPEDKYVARQRHLIKQCDPESDIASCVTMLLLDNDITPNYEEIYSTSPRTATAAQELLANKKADVKGRVREIITGTVTTQPDRTQFCERIKHHGSAIVVLKMRTDNTHVIILDEIQGMSDAIIREPKTGRAYKVDAKFLLEESSTISAIEFIQMQPSTQSPASLSESTPQRGRSRTRDPEAASSRSETPAPTPRTPTTESSNQSPFAPSLFGEEGS